MNPSQLGLFEPNRSLPAGFRYQTDLATSDHERGLLERFARLVFTEFQFQGMSGSGVSSPS